MSTILLNREEKKDQSSLSILVVRGTQHNYIVTFPPANRFYSKQLTLVPSADLKNVIVWYAQLQ